MRPDGEKGLLVNTLEACEEYYRRRAELWEIQALTRVRPVAGNLELGARFRRLAAALTDFSRPPEVAAYTPGWLEEIDRMRGASRRNARRRARTNWPSRRGWAG